MGRVKAVRLEDLLNGNPTLCLSPLRAAWQCHRCQRFRDAYAHGREFSLTCRPRIPREVWRLLGRRRRLLEELRKIDRRLWG